MTGHVTDERFVQLTRAIKRIVVPSSLVGQEVCVKVVAPGQTLADVTSQCFTIVAPNSPYLTPGPSFDFSVDTNSQNLILAL